MFLRQLFDTESSSYTYVVADETTREAAVIDPVRERSDAVLEVVAAEGLRLLYSLETHIHADHISAGSVLRDRTGARLGMHARATACDCADIPLEDGNDLTVGGLRVRVLETPGHTPDSLSYLVEEPSGVRHVFTGDALLIGTCGRTDFQGGDPGSLYDSIHERLFTLGDEVIVWPAHDYKGNTSTTIGEQRRSNERAAGRSREAFIELMNNLALPPPKKIGIAVPANRHCGHDPHGA